MMLGGMRSITPLIVSISASVNVRSVRSKVPEDILMQRSGRKGVRQSVKLSLYHLYSGEHAPEALILIILTGNSCGLDSKILTLHKCVNSENIVVST